jgi:DNA-binding beta-propeller fold protein YncE
VEKLRAAIIAAVGGLAALALLAAAPSAPADVTFCPPGPGAGQCKDPDGLASDFESGRVYIADAGNNRVDVFESDGTFLFAFGTGQLSHPENIAIDNDPASASHHDVYVTDVHNARPDRVLKFGPEGSFLLGFGWGVADGKAKAETCGPEASPPTGSCLPGLEGKGVCQFGGRGGDPLGVGPGGSVLVADSPKWGASDLEDFNSRIEKFDSSGGCVDEIPLLEKKPEFFRDLAVDPAGNAYVTFAGAGGLLQKLGPTGEVLCEDPGTEDPGTSSEALAVDPSGALFAAEREATLGFGIFHPLTEYDSNCNPLRRFGYEVVAAQAFGLAFFHSGAGDLFVSQNEGKPITYLPLPLPGPTIVPSSVEAKPLSNTKATLRALVNPNSKPTDVLIEYVAQATCEKDVGEGGECFEDAVISAPQSLGVEDVSLHSASAQFGCPHPVSELSEGKCLTPETKYRFRVIAENTDGEGNSPVDGGIFETRPWLEILSTWSTEVGTDSARLHAEVNPLGVATSGYFEYVDDAHFQESGFADATQVPDVSGGEAPIDFGEGEGATTRSASPFPLAPATTYHYRLAVKNPLIEPVLGPVRTFRTFAKTLSEPCLANEAFRIGPAALLPDCRAYEMVSPLDKEDGDIIVSVEFSTNLPAVLDQSATSGSRFAYGSYRAFGDANSAPLTPQYIAARSEAAKEWVSHGISPPRGHPIYPAIPSLDTEFKAFSPDLCEAWLRSVSEPPLAPGAQAGYVNLYRKADEECGGPAYEALTTAEWPDLAPGNEYAAKLELQGVSADGSDAIYLAPDSLAGSGALPQELKCTSKEEGCAFELYVQKQGAPPVFACVPPAGVATPKSCSAGINSTVFTGHNSSASLQGAISADGERIFWTDSGAGPGKIYVREHAEQGKVAGECDSKGRRACTIAVSRKGEELSGTTASRFHAAAGNGSAAIFTTGAEGAKDLYEFAVDTNTTRLIAHGVKGVLGVSEDAFHVYFVSTEAKGSPNSQGDTAQAGKPNLYLDDEGMIAFVGTLSPQDVTIGLASPVDPEPRLHLARVSADGLHAAFMSNAPLTGYDNTDANSGEADDEIFLYDATSAKLICASCNPSGQRPVGVHNIAGEEIIREGPPWLAAQIPVYENNLYASRVLSGDGARLFFDSQDALAARDTNGSRDVYEWEDPGGPGSGCTQESPTFSPQNEGCVDLISSGQSARPSAFLDASPTGNDVFFTTLSSLVPQDYGLVDVYDARAGGGFPPPPPQAEECEGEACQGALGPPGAPTPATSVLGASGQVLPKGCGKGRRPVLRKGKRRCVPQHKRRHKGQARGRARR